MLSDTRQNSYVGINNLIGRGKKKHEKWKEDTGKVKVWFEQESYGDAAFGVPDD